MANSVLPADVEVLRFDLFSLDGNRQVNMLSLFNQINIYENMLKSTITGDIIINDSINLLNTFPIINEEKIVIEFKTPGSDNSVTYNFIIYAIENLTNGSQNKSKAYTLKLCSEEFYHNATHLVNKAYNTEISNIIEDILTSQIKTDKPVFLENSKGVQNLVLTKKKPFIAIDMVRSRAVSKKYLSSSFVFFENQRGYNFATMETFFDMNKDRIGDKEFFHDSTAQWNVETIQKRNILGYQYVGLKNNMTQLGLGGLNTNVNTFDIVTGDFLDASTKLREKQNQFKFSDPSIGYNTSGFSSKFDSEAATSLFHAIDSSRPDTFIRDSLAPLQIFVSQIIQSILQVYVYGDSTITVGDVVSLHVPEVTGLSTTGDKDDRLYSGKYLITKLRHIITNGSRRSHSMSLELVKGTFSDV